MILFAIFPFDLRGPDFLVFYVFFCVMVFALAGYLRWQSRQPSDVPAELPDDPYEIAWLAGREKMVAFSAIAQLVAMGNIETVDPGKGVRAVARPATNCHPVEEFAYSQVAETDTASVRAVIATVCVVAEPLEYSLRERGFLLDRTTRSQTIFLPALLGALPLVVGIIKIFVGIARDRPVEILVLLSVVAAVAYCVIFLRTPFRSRRGDAALEILRQKHGGRLAGSGGVAKNVHVMLALFGVQVLASTSLAALIPVLQPPSTGSGDNGSGCGSSCGGGGGGGGGGCGGCGGGH